MDFKNCRVVALDFDGTLAKTDYHLNARTATYKSLALETGDKRYDIDEQLHLQASEQATTPEGINAYILAAKGIISTVDPMHDSVKNVVDQVQQMYQQIIRNGQDEIPGSVAFMRRLMVRRPGKVGIVTTAHEWEVNPFLDRYKLNRYFLRHKLVTREDLSSNTNVKPNSEAYEIFMERMGVKVASECLAIEDSKLGIEAAKKAGFLVIGLGYADKYNKLVTIDSEYKPDAVVHDYQELGTLIGVSLSGQ